MPNEQRCRARDANEALPRREGALLWTINPPESIIGLAIMLPPRLSPRSAGVAPAGFAGSRRWPGIASRRALGMQEFRLIQSIKCRLGIHKWLFIGEREYRAEVPVSTTDPYEEIMHACEFQCSRCGHVKRLGEGWVTRVPRT